MSTLETTFGNHLRAALNAPMRQTRVVRCNAGTFKSFDCRRVVEGLPEGVADYVGIVRPEGWLVAVETKAERGKKREAQERFRRLVEAFGGVYVRPRYDEAQTLEENVARCVAEVDAAIAERRARA